jgi:hypothetical protein
VHLVGACGAGRRDATWAGHGDDRGAGDLGELDGEAADTAARAVDQDALPRPHAQLLVDRLPGGEPGDRQGGGVGERDRHRRWSQRLHRDGDVLAVAAVRGPRQEGHDPVARRGTAHARAEFDDGAGQVHTQDLRHRELVPVAHAAGADEGVTGIEGSAGGVDQHLTAVRDGPRCVLVAQPLGAAVLVHVDGFHGLLSEEAVRRPVRHRPPR